ncbi:MAG: hypothetical protein ABGY41_15935, partial [Candidatus Poribacteria bacterium]
GWEGCRMRRAYLSALAIALLAVGVGSPAHDLLAGAVAFGPGGTLFASGSEDDMARLRDVESLEVVGVLQHSSGGESAA